MVRDQKPSGLVLQEGRLLSILCSSSPLPSTPEPSAVSSTWEMQQDGALVQTQGDLKVNVIECLHTFSECHRKRYERDGGNPALLWEDALCSGVRVDQQSWGTRVQVDGHLLGS